jgi:hypothetical protein
MDDDIAASKSNSMRVHNVIIVVPKEVKEKTKQTNKAAVAKGYLKEVYK